MISQLTMWLYSLLYVKTREAPPPLSAPNSLKLQIVTQTAISGKQHTVLYIDAYILKN